MDNPRIRCCGASFAYGSISMTRVTNLAVTCRSQPMGDPGDGCPCQTLFRPVSSILSLFLTCTLNPPPMASLQDEIKALFS